MSELKDFLNGGGSLAPQVNDNTEAIASKVNNNFIINGDCIVSQISTNQQTGITHGSHPYDGWRVGLGGIASINTDRVSGDYPTSNLASSFKATYPTAHTITSTSFNYFEQNLDGIDAKNLIDVEFTLSFWVKSSTSGTFAVSLQKFDSTYSYIAPVIVNTANTWEFKEITVSGGLPNSLGFEKSGVGSLRVRFCPVAGSNYQTSTVSQWIAGNYLGVTGNMNVAASANNTFHFTGVKLEIGNNPTRFISDFESELRKCQRRYQKHPINAGTKVSTTSAGTFLGYSAVLPVNMRTTPTVTYSADGQVNKFYVESLGYLTPASGGVNADTVKVWVNAFSTTTGAGNWYYVTVELSSQIV